MDKKYPKPLNLFEISKSVSDKLFHTNPFRLLTNQVNRDYSDLIVEDCGVTEKAIHEILVNSFDADSIFLDVVGDDNEVSAQGEAVVIGYTKAIDALEKLASKKVVAEDKNYSGFAKGRGKISLREAIQDDIDDLKQKRAKWAGLFIVHPELKIEQISKTITGMVTNQAYNVFLYIKKCHEKAGYKAENVSIYDLISELFMAIYDHPFFNAVERFTPIKIKEYCDNGPRQRKLRKSSLRKSLKSL